jgi:hypothetical protein
MPQRYVVGFRIAGRYRHVQVDGEDALHAAQRVKAAHPEAHITYARKHNSRADERHPEPMLGEERAGDQGSGARVQKSRRAASKIPKVPARDQEPGVRSQDPGGKPSQQAGATTQHSGERRRRPLGS